VLKGGYAMELRIKAARTTKDIDLAMRKNYFMGVGVDVLRRDGDIEVVRSIQ
jgi:hypothetical protein